jgi:two-component system, response regulator
MAKFGQRQQQVRGQNSVFLFLRKQPVDMVNNAVEILLIEDNAEDAELTIRALRKFNLANHLLHLQDGEEALNFLFSSDAYTMPKIILLDIKMPKVDGIEVLRRIKSDPYRKIIPVVVLTSSKEERDIIESYKLGVNAYIVKPVEFEKFIKAVSDIGFFWLILNEPPK